VLLWIAVSATRRRRRRRRLFGPPVNGGFRRWPYTVSKSRFAFSLVAAAPRGLTLSQISQRLIDGYAVFRLLSSASAIRGELTSRSLSIYFVTAAFEVWLLLGQFLVVGVASLSVWFPSAGLCRSAAARLRLCWHSRPQDFRPF